MLRCQCAPCVSITPLVGKLITHIDNIHRPPQMYPAITICIYNSDTHSQYARMAARDLEHKQPILHLDHNHSFYSWRCSKCILPQFENGMFCTAFVLLSWDSVLRRRYYKHFIDAKFTLYLVFVFDRPGVAWEPWQNLNLFQDILNLDCMVGSKVTAFFTDNAKTYISVLADQPTLHIIGGVIRGRVCDQRGYPV